MVEKEQRGFEDLECYQLGLQVFREANRVALRRPIDERYILPDQLRRAAASIVLNIAEGYGRYHFLDCLRFYYMARGSMMEVLSGLIACSELRYTNEESSAQRELCHSALRSLNGYIRFVRSQRQGQKEYGEHVLKEDAPHYELTDVSPQ